MGSRVVTRASWRPHVVVVDAGFCGLAAAYEFGQRGIRIPALECDEDIGGLVGNFLVGGTRVEKFYHHWFTNDVHVMRLTSYQGGVATQAIPFGLKVEQSRPIRRSAGSGWRRGGGRGSFPRKRSSLRTA